MRRDDAENLDNSSKVLECSNVIEMPPYRGGRFGGGRKDDKIPEAVL